ncbi:hypothetical protein [Sediminibacterium salmoneum]|uniref:hypothetical protein n=1 Tax=Sediminibacterium salmoneum TaxID=426421 RepID=UPI00047EDE3D|nr:hypothetical protein [Sediminibacterium salmoneum]
MRIFIIGIIAFSFLQLSCTKNDNLTNTTFRVKIIKEVCNDAIVQLVDKQSSEIAENGFAFEGKTYNNVFFTTFSCADRNKMQTLTSDLTGLVITVKLLSAPKDEPNCGRCRATVGSRPGKSNYIEVIGL